MSPLLAPVIIAHLGVVTFLSDIKDYSRRMGMGLGPTLERHNAFQWDLAA